MASADSNRANYDVDAAVPISDVIRDPRRRSLSDEDLAQQIRYRWRGCIDFSRDLRLTRWVRNALMTFGPQDIRWSRRADRWLSVPVKRPRQYSTPLLPGRLALFAARMVQSAPDWSAIAQDDTVEAEEQARFCDRLLRYCYRTHHVDLVRYFNVIQMALFGFGLSEVYLQDDADFEYVYLQKKGPSGEPLFDEVTGMPMYEVDADGNQVIDKVEPRPGIKCRPVSPFSFAVPPGVEWPLLEECPYVMRASWLSEEYVRRRFEVPRDVVLTTDTTGDYEAMTSYLWQAGTPHAMGARRFESGRLLVLQYHEPARDVKGFYDGKVYTVVGNHLIGDERALLDKGRYPFFMFPWLPVTDSFYPFPWMDPQIDPQMRINQTLTHQMDHLARVGSPNIIADAMSGFPTEPEFFYKVYFTSPGLRRPEVMQFPPLPPGAYQMHQEAKRDMDEVSTSFGPARGENVPGATSGEQVRAIQAADQTEMGPIVALHATEFGRMGEAYLELYRKHGGKDRKLGMLAESGEREYFAFMRSKIPVDMKVQVQQDSLLVHYRSALIEEAEKMAASGAFGNMLTEQTARDKYLSAIRDPKLSGAKTPEQVQADYIKDIHYEIIHEGKVPQVEPWWDLQAHREQAHLRLLRESKKWDPPTYQRFMGYWQAIEQAIQAVEAEKQKQQQAAIDQQIQAEKQVADNEQTAKAKVELLRQTGKLALESMKGDQGVAAGAGIGGTTLNKGNGKTDGKSGGKPKEGSDA